MTRPTPDRPFAGSLFARNLKRLIDLQAEGSVNGWCRSKKLPQATINRIVIGTSDATTEMVAKIGAAAGYAPWQMLLPDFEPSAVPPTMNVKAMRIAAIYAQLSDARDQARMAAIAELFVPDGIAVQAAKPAPGKSN